MRFRKLIFIAFLGVALAAPAQQETRSHYQVYGGYSWLSNTFNGLPGSHHQLNGWDASLGFRPWHGLRFKIDTFAYDGTNLGAPQRPLFITAGGEYSRRFRRESVFVEGLFGECGLNQDWGPQKTQGGTASFATVFGGGLDTPVARHFNLRVGGDFINTNFALVAAGPVSYRIPGLPQNFAKVTTGLVWGF